MLFFECVILLSLRRSELVTFDSLLACANPAPLRIISLLLVIAALQCFSNDEERNEHACVVTVYNSHFKEVGSNVKRFDMHCTAIMNVLCIIPSLAPTHNATIAHAAAAGTSAVHVHSSLVVLRRFYYWHYLPRRRGRRPRWYMQNLPLYSWRGFATPVAESRNLRPDILARPPLSCT